MTELEFSKLVSTGKKTTHTHTPNENKRCKNKVKLERKHRKLIESQFLGEQVGEIACCLGSMRWEAMEKAPGDLLSYPCVARCAIVMEQNTPGNLSGYSVSPRMLRRTYSGDQVTDHMLDWVLRTFSVCATEGDLFRWSPWPAVCLLADTELALLGTWDRPSSCFCSGSELRPHHTSSNAAALTPETSGWNSDSLARLSRSHPTFRQLLSHSQTVLPQRSLKRP